MTSPHEGNRNRLLIGLKKAPHRPKQKAVPHGRQRTWAISSAGHVAVLTLVMLLAASCAGSPTPEQRSVTISTAGCGYATAVNSSGVVVDTGLVLTAAHSVRGSSAIDVTTTDGGTYPATVVGLDMRPDLALLSVPELSEPAVEVGAATAGDVGEIVGASSSGTVPYLVRRAIHITIDRIGGRGGYERSGHELEADTRTGDSGAGAFDDDDRLIGIVFATSEDESNTTWITAGSEVSSFLAADRSGPWVCDTGKSRVEPTG